MTQALALGFVASIYFRVLGMADPWVPLVWFVAWGIAWLFSEISTERKIRIHAKWAAQEAADAIARLNNDSCRCK